MPRKILIVGLDGVTWSALDPMIEKGHMPFLKQEIAGGRAGVLASTEPPITPTAWTSFQTGLPPERHNVLGFRRYTLENGRFQAGINLSSSVGAQRIWDILSGQGRKIGIINLPLTYPPFPVNGVLVSGFPVPSADADFTYPPGFKDEILRMVPDFEVMQSGLGARQKGRTVEEIVDGWVRMMSQKTLVARHLLEREPWDVFMIHVQETDMMQHFLWQCIDPSDPDHRPGDFARVARFYSKLDAEVGSLIERGRERGFSVLLLSDHGFQRCLDDVKINSWLYQKGYLVLRKDAKRVLISMLSRVIELPLFYKLRAKIRFSRAVAGTTNSYLGSVVDYEKSVAFAEANATNVAFLHFLTRDRSAIEKVLDDVRGMKNETGRGLLADAARMEEPDHLVYKLIFEQNTMASGTVPSARFWIEHPVPMEQMVGMHHRDGIIVLDSTLEDMDVPKDIHNVPGLIMKLQRIPFDPLASGAEQNPEPIAPGAPCSGRDGMEAEKAEIEDQLKSLGYL